MTEYKRFGELLREEQLDIMTYWLDTGRIEVNSCIEGLETESNCWYSITMPAWCLEGYYRKPVTKPSIDWDQVSLGYNYLATDKNGKSFLYPDYPEVSVYGDTFWSASKALGFPVGAEIFSSFVKGTCDWKDSIVERPLLYGL
jgi:hypothetical protein